MKGSHIHKSYLGKDQVISLSKGTTIQVWDVNTSKQTYQAKNVPHDELDLEVPIFDTGLTFTDSSKNTVAVCTGYGAVRHYDFRAGKKARTNAQVLQNEMLISHIVQSQVNGNQLYIIDQWGCVHILD